jgi:Fe-S cluster biogenesis protein NfuA
VQRTEPGEFGATVGGGAEHSGSIGHDGQKLAARGVAPDVNNADATVEPRADFEVIGDHPQSAKRITDLNEIIEVIRPVIAADGGELRLLSVDVAAGIVSLQLAGACGSCAVAGDTLNQGVDRILHQRLDWVTEVIGVVEESDVTGYGGWTPTAH